MGVLRLSNILAALEVSQKYPVFPCNDAKEPLTPNGFKDATRDELTILGWWAKYPDALVAVPTGAASGLVVIDQDTVKKPDPASLAWVTTNAQALTSGALHTTRSGGKHYIFTGSDVRSRSAIRVDGVKLRAIDTRGEGGYIIWWPAHGLPRIGEPTPLPAALAAMVSQASAAPVTRVPTPPSEGWIWEAQKLEITAALAYLDPDDRDTWYQTGMSIKSAGGDAGFDIWHEWSKQSPKYIDEEDCAFTWHSFKGTAASLRGIGSLFKDARENGYTGGVAPAMTVTVGVPKPPAVPPPPSPDALPVVAPATQRGAVVTAPGQLAIFENYTYVEDIYKILTPRGDLLGANQFDARFGGREFLTTITGDAPTSSAWDCFINSKIIEFPKVRGMFFDPRLPPQTVEMREGVNVINSWKPVEIRSEPGDVAPFLNHLKILFPLDWHILLNYLKFMVQHKGVKAKWWPFLQGVQGNGKSFISDTMEYCIGKKYTQRPTPKNIDSQFNASLYGCLFIALEDVKVKEDHGAIWETLKPMVTGESLEIQPKGVDKITREVCFNAILNSNHKDGIRIEPNERRLAPFFAAQQSKSDLARDGLTKPYFWDLWAWAKLDGWAHVAHYLSTDPIDDELNPATQCIIAPVTSSTTEALAYGLGAVEQSIMENIKFGIDGFRGGWISRIRLDQLLATTNRARSITPLKRHDMLETLGYVRLPGVITLSGGLCTELYVTEGHAALKLNDTDAVRALYEKHQKT